MKNYRNNYYGSILDPIHGDIKLSEIEKWCISHPLFLRLRKVKQNTFLYYVFPSALHTRFEHSIGVMHIAGKIFDVCKENFATGQKKKEKYGETSQSSFFDLSNLEESKEEIYYQELRLAALLHDIGHGPLSHLFDSFLMSRESFFSCINSEPYLKTFVQSFESICPKGKEVKHEHISCIFVLKIFNDLRKHLKINPQKLSPSAKDVFNNIEPTRVIKLIESKFHVKKDFLDNNGNNYSSFFSKIISGFPLDADRMDYLLRDSYFSGVNYGLYDINRLFASFMATENEKSIELTIKESGIDSVLRFIQSRTHLYNQVYFHKTNRAANTMLSASTATNKGKIKLLENKNIDELEIFYTLNSDEYFINETVSNKLNSNYLERKILTDLNSRKLFKRLFEYKIVLTPSNFEKKKEIEKIVENIRMKLKILESKKTFGFVDEYTNEAFKDSDNKSIKVAKKDKLTGIYKFDSNWSSLNQEFANANVISIMVRVFLMRTFKNPKEFKNLKEQVLAQLEKEIKEIQSIT